MLRPRVLPKRSCKSTCAATIRIARAALAFSLLLFGAASTLRAEVYTFRDARGVDHFASSPRPGWRLFDLHSDAPDPASYDAIIRECAAEYAIDPSLIKAVIRAESGFDPDAVSSKGARGLMQLTQRTAHAHGVANLHDPRQNIHAGARHLRALLDRFANDRTLALAAYNAGAGTISRYRGVPPYRETRSYVRKVLRFHREYRRAAHSA